MNFVLLLQKMLFLANDLVIKDAPKYMIKVTDSMLSLGGHLGCVKQLMKADDEVVVLPNSSEKHIRFIEEYFNICDKALFSDDMFKKPLDKVTEMKKEDKDLEIFEMKLLTKYKVYDAKSTKTTINAAQEWLSVFSYLDMQPISMMFCKIFVLIYTINSAEQICRLYDVEYPSEEVLNAERSTELFEDIFRRCPAVGIPESYRKPKISVTTSTPTSTSTSAISSTSVEAASTPK